MLMVLFVEIKSAIGSYELKAEAFLPIAVELDSFWPVSLQQSLADEQRKPCWAAWSYSVLLCDVR